MFTFQETNKKLKNFKKLEVDSFSYLYRLGKTTDIIIWKKFETHPI